MELVYRQVNSQKAVAGSSFTQGVQDFNFSIGGKNAWVPSRSYFRISLSLTAKNGVQPEKKDQIAFADGVCGNLYNNIYFRGGGVDISSLVNYTPQVSMLKNRLSKSGSWLSTIGKTAYRLDPDFQSRVKSVSSDQEITLENSTRKSVGTDDYKVVIATDGGVLGTNTTFQVSGVVVGDKMVADGVIYTVLSITSDTVMTVDLTPSADITYEDGSFQKLELAQSSEDGKNTIYAMWQPSIGIFDEASPMGSGDYRISLNPNSYYKNSCVQSFEDNLSPPDFDIVVNSVEFYVATVKADVMPTGIETLHLKEMDCQTKIISNLSGNNTLDFQVPPSTYALTVFCQSSDAGNNTKIPPSLFKTKDNSDLKIKSLQLSYGNVVKPSTRWSSDFKSDTNLLSQRYHDSQLESGMIFSEGGCESFSDYIKRGPYYHYSFQKDKNDPSTYVSVSVDFDGLEDKANLFVVAHYTKTVQLTINHGFISDVVSSNI